MQHCLLRPKKCLTSKNTVFEIYSVLNNKVKINAITAVAIVAAVIFIDQSIKFYVKTNFALHEAHEITSWMYLYFVENSGMAFGVNIAGTLILTVARLIFVGFLIYYISRISRKNVPRGYIICISLIIAGALGNIIDNAIYGMIFSESTDYNVASLVSSGEGYGSFMSGKVVDMFYFPIIDTYLPYNLPLIGGEHFVFFAPIFNFADSAITCGSLCVILFYRKYLSATSKSSHTQESK